ncbi:type IV secretory system conjugative DNA transfer family protein [Phaeobacter gallaeciensis]|uniref:type IV secretory system conjugative DNA transfer family protein n=1 Tax=Phaeobacter gallaeciensis TaxID=60890 RepID=UPI00237FB4CC|nr:type IV secretory system conjugative DNA transfer family protein [Phaeobacter gallaeciensis]MDE4100294.1 type IV secretory system conjugative DNA transfer family protein [Phaeobacter gallaeciensis]MDE4109098.1 type IV secretory system conjugative DNA transfer family protein [Phaeobacter gallaeciensis]MDE4113563.1 type IV secretory system conjugative DNA transfer family protein [Phaeobacter gallaeciensis]MDE4118031.1 type IV secretory system conjugative DNA transfer family protein [Phaeobacte
MNQKNGHTPSVMGKLVVTTALGAALWQTFPVAIQSRHTLEWGLYAWGIGAAAFTAGTIGLAQSAGQMVLGGVRQFRAFRPKRSDSSSRWLSAREARKSGLATINGMLLGIVDGQPVFIPNAVHSLVCAPARKGKSTSAVMAALCHDIGRSRLVADMKGELQVQTARLIEEEHGHRVISLNPAHKFDLPNFSYNPFQIILDALAFAPQDAVSDARSLAIQLHPDPAGGARDPFWPLGTRKLLTFVIIALCVLRDGEEANLPRAFEVMGRNTELFPLLLEARKSDALGGELAVLADNLLITSKKTEKQFESFREGAIQSLAPFGPSGRLAASVTACDFRFRDLKREHMTIFMISDPSRMDVFAPWTSLMVWAALKELIREDNAIPVQFILDEFSNYRLPGLPEALTALGGYGVRCQIVVQELREIARVYGHEALETILSQTDVKQFFGVASDATAQLVSRMLGEEIVTSASFGLGSELGRSPDFSLGRKAKPLLSPEQVRRLPDDEQIIFVRNLRPIRALKVGYHETSPWRDQVEPNPFHGDERFIGTRKMVIRNGRARSTRAGRRGTKQPSRPFWRPFFGALRPLTPGFPAILLAIVALTIVRFGWPHLLWEYTRSGSWCRYLSLPVVSQPFNTYGNDHCPLIVWKKPEVSK